MINYNLQEAIQTDRKTGLPVNRYEYADNLNELKGVLVQGEENFIQGYKEGTKEAQKLQHTKRLNEYQQQVNNLMQTSRRRETPHSEIVDSLQQINDNFIDLTPAEKSAITQDEGFANVKPAATRMYDKSQDLEAERWLKENTLLQNVATQYVGPDKASQMTDEELISTGKRLVSEEKAFKQIIDDENDQDTSPTIKYWNRREAADLVSEWVQQDATIELEAGRPLSPKWLSNERNSLYTKLVQAGLKDNSATLDYIVTKALDPIKYMVEGTQKSVEDQKNYLGFLNQGKQSTLEMEFSARTGLPTSASTAAMQPGVDPELQRTLLKAVNAQIADRKLNQQLVEDLSNGLVNADGTPNLRNVGANTDKILQLEYLTDNQKAFTINAATQGTTETMSSPFRVMTLTKDLDEVLSEPITMHIEGETQVYPMSFEQRLLTPVRRFTGEALYNRQKINKYHEDNSEAEMRVMEYSTENETQMRKNNTDNLISTCTDLLMEMSIDSKGAISYKNDRFSSTNDEDRALIDKINLECIAPSEKVDTLFNNKLIDKVRFDRAMQEGIKNFNLDVPNAKRPWYQRTADYAFNPMENAIYGKDDTAREATLRAATSGPINRSRFADAIQNAWRGTLVGAGIGTFMPGVGTIAGAGLGAISGLTYEFKPELTKASKAVASAPFDFSKYLLTGEGIKDLKEFIRTGLERMRKGSPVEDISPYVDEWALAFTKYVTEELPAKYASELKGAKIALKAAANTAGEKAEAIGQWGLDVLSDAGEGAADIANRILERKK